MGKQCLVAVVRYSLQLDVHLKARLPRTTLRCAILSHPVLREHFTAIYPNGYPTFPRAT